jgi:hypothetical protein
VTPRACRCGHWLRAHQHLPGAEGCGRCPCPAFRPPLVVTHRDWVLRALVAAVVLVGLAAATALLATRGSGDVRRGIAAQPSIEKVASGSPTGDR